MYELDNYRNLLSSVVILKNCNTNLRNDYKMRLLAYESQFDNANFKDYKYEFEVFQKGFSDFFDSVQPKLDSIHFIFWLNKDMSSEINSYEQYYYDSWISYLIDFKKFLYSSELNLFPNIREKLIFENIDYLYKIDNKNDLLFSLLIYTNRVLELENLFLVCNINEVPILIEQDVFNIVKEPIFRIGM
jgi:hypothetical protein